MLLDCFNRKLFCPSRLPIVRATSRSCYSSTRFPVNISCVSLARCCKHRFYLSLSVLGAHCIRCLNQLRTENQFSLCFFAFTFKKKSVLNAPPTGFMIGVMFCLIPQRAYVISASRGAVLKEMIMQKIKKGNPVFVFVWFPN